jgi:hypothetical protein
MPHPNHAAIKTAPIQQPQRFALVGRTIVSVGQETDHTGDHWTRFTFDDGTQLVILDTHPWVFIDAQVM